MISEQLQRDVEKANEVITFLNSEYTASELWNVWPFMTAAIMYTVHEASNGKTDLKEMLDAFIPLVESLYELLAKQEAKK